MSVHLLLTTLTAKKDINGKEVMNPVTSSSRRRSRVIQSSVSPIVPSASRLHDTEDEAGPSASYSSSAVGEPWWTGTRSDTQNGKGRETPYRIRTVLTVSQPYLLKNLLAELIHLKAKRWPNWTGVSMCRVLSVYWPYASREDSELEKLGQVGGYCRVLSRLKGELLRANACCQADERVLIWLGNYWTV